MTYIPRSIAISITVVVAAAVAALVMVLVPPSAVVAPMPPSANNGQSLPPPSPPPPPPSLFSGNVINISQENQTITLGTYRIENNKAVLASTKVIQFNSDTVFAREQISQAKSVAENRISVGDLKVRDLVEVQTTGASGDPVAKKITVLTIPPPPRKP